MKYFIIGGHHDKDPGAVANGLREYDLAREFRDLLAGDLRALGAEVITDDDTHDLAATIRAVRAAAAPSDLLADLHFNAASPAATGAEVFVSRIATNEVKKRAATLATVIASALGIPNRGQKTEDQTRHGRLGVLHCGMYNSYLAELAFITNPSDVAAYEAKKETLARVLAKTLFGYSAKK